MSTRQNLSINTEACTVAVPGRSGKVVYVAVEYSRATRNEEDRYIVRDLIGTVMEGNIFNLLSWASHCSRIPVKSTPVANILAASEPVDDIAMLKNPLSKIINEKIATMGTVDSKDLQFKLSLEWNKIGTSFPPDVNKIRFSFESVPGVNVFTNYIKV